MPLAAPGQAQVNRVASLPPMGIDDPSWWGWGDPAHTPVLPDAVLKLLTDGLGVREGPGHPGSMSELELAPPRLERQAASALAEVVGQEWALDDHETRIRHVRGKSTIDLLRLRLGDVAS